MNKYIRSDVCSILHVCVCCQRRETAFMLATKQGYVEIVQLLLNAGAIVNVRSKVGDHVSITVSFLSSYYLQKFLFSEYALNTITQLHTTLTSTHQLKLSPTSDY